MQLSDMQEVPSSSLQSGTSSQRRSQQGYKRQCHTTWHVWSSPSTLSRRVEEEKGRQSTRCGKATTLRITSLIHPLLHSLRRYYPWKRPASAQVRTLSTPPLPWRVLHRQVQPAAELHDEHATVCPHHGTKVFRLCRRRYSGHVHVGWPRDGQQTGYRSS